MEHKGSGPVVASRRVVLAGVTGLALGGCRDQASPPAGATPEPPAPARAQALRVEVTHDTVCPWCRIGCHNLHAALDSLGPSGVEVVYRPYLLEPDLPPQGADLRERLGKKYGAERVASMFTGVTQAGARYGVRFDFNRVRIAPQTAPSHALIAWAPAARRRALVTAIHLAYFEQGEDIGAPAVLASLARGLGLDGDAALAAVSDATRLGAVRQQAAAAQAGGMSGVPHFVIGARELHGAQSPEALREALLGA